jgi:hypothetical protein
MIKKLFYLSLFLIVTEGIMRKWFFPSLSMQIYILKYLVVLVLWIAFFASNYARHLKKKDYPYYLIGFLFFIFAVLDYFMSYFSIKIWLIGMLSYFGFVIYILVVPIVIDNKKKLDTFITYIINVSIVAIIVGFIQFYLPPTHPLNSYAAQEETHIALAGGMVRITSIFNYITGNSTFLSLVVPLIFIYSITEKKIGKKIVLIILLMLGVFDTFATGSRLTVFFMFFSVGLVLLFMVFQRKSAHIKRLMVYGILSLIIVSILGVTNLLQLESFFSFFDRVQNINDSSFGRVLWMLESIVSAGQIAGPTGFGIGSTTNMALSLGGGILNLFNVHDLFGDQPMGRTIMEIGIVGFLIYIVLLIVILGDLFRKIANIKDSKLQLTAFVFWTTILQYVAMMNNTIFNWMGSVHFWLVAGLIISISHIDRDLKKSGNNG